MTDDAKKLADENADLKRRVEALEAAQPKPEPTWEERERASAKFRDEMHQMRERRASVIPPWMRDAVAGGVSDADAADIVRASHAPQGPSSQGAIPSSQQVSNVRGAGGVPGGGTGWAREIPLGPSIHQRYVDAQIDAQDAKDRQELIKQKAKEAALLKAAESKP